MELTFRRCVTIALLLAAGAATESVLRFEYSIGTTGKWTPLFSISAELSSAGVWQLPVPSPFQFTESELQLLVEGAAANDNLLVKVIDSTGGSVQTAFKEVNA